MFWLLVAPSVGVLLSGLFNYPDYLGTSLQTTFGRLRPVHVNGVIFGAFSSLFIGECYYLVPRLCGVRVPWSQWNVPLAWVWNITTAAALISLMFGENHGLEAGEFPLFAKIPIFIVCAVATAQFLMAIARRLEPPLYVALWYLIGAFVWTTMNLVLGILLPYMITGINSAAFHGLYIHYIVGLWLTPAGYVLIYYFLPLSVRNPIYAHKLSLVGFWSLALFYPFVGIHHYLYSPIADWAETIAIVTSMLLIIPVWTVLVNFFGTVMGRWDTMHRNLPAKFLIMGAIMYLFGCFQGSTEALRQIQQPTHFTDFVISHSHLTVFGTFVVWAMGGLVYVWPRACGRELWSFKMGNWAFWMITAGISTMGLGLTAGGLNQGFQWMAGTEWVDSILSMRPYWFLRTVAGISMDIGMTLLVINLMLTALVPSGSRRRTPGLRHHPDAGRRSSPMSARFVTLVAGIACFFAALITQGFLPFFETSARTTKVSSVVRTDLGQLKWMITDATDYTPLQQRGRDVYLREGCWYCHSQFVRPVTGETRRWGPVAELGEFAFDVPHLFGTRRIGPDLLRVGLKYSDEWHYAHFWNPRMLTPDSVMAPYRGLFDASDQRTAIVDDGAGNRTLEKTPRTEALFDFASQQQIRLTPNSDGMLFVPRRARDKAPVIQSPTEDFNLDTVQIVAETEDLEALVAYVQKLGMNRGKWRDLFEPQQLEVMNATFPRSEEWIQHGKEVYERRCLGCHGVNRGRQRACGDLHVQPAPAQLQRRRLQVPADQGAIAHGRRPAAHDHARGARNGDAGLVRAAAQRSPRGHPVHQVRARRRPLRPGQPLCVFRRRAAWPAVVHREAARRVTADHRSRQGGLAGREMLGVPRPGRKGRRREGRRAEGRSGLRHHPGRPHQRPVQVRPRGGGHLPHHDDRA